MSVGKKTYRLGMERTESVLPVGASFYSWMLLGFLLLWIIALGGGMWGQQASWPHQWQHMLFGEICHQVPDRSFWLGGQPMAVCARCFGLYTALLGGWVMIPWFNDLRELVQPIALPFIFVAVGLNLMDVVADYFSIWHNTLFSRCLLGAILGIAAVSVLISNSK